MLDVTVDDEDDDDDVDDADGDVNDASSAFDIVVVFVITTTIDVLALIKSGGQCQWHFKIHAQVTKHGRPTRTVSFEGRKAWIQVRVGYPCFVT
jgi:hypothetical protein